MTDTAPTELHLPVPVHDRLASLVDVAFPFETCGLLIGRTEGERVVVERIHPARNRSSERARDRYELDPDDFLAADNAARADGREIVGIWHSHPDHPAEPSRTDLEAAWEGYSYLIVSISCLGETEFRSWRLHGERFLEEPFHLTRRN